MEVEIIELEERCIFGLSKNSNDITIAKDINEVSKEYLKIVNRDFVLSKNYDKKQ